jgi:hypothetical protein
MATQKIRVTQTMPYSSEVNELRKQFNALLSELESVADFATLQTDLAAGVAKEVEVTLEGPAPHVGQYPNR